jgi:hypothetical protein
MSQHGLTAYAGIAVNLPIRVFTREVEVRISRATVTNTK